MLCDLCWLFDCDFPGWVFGITIKFDFAWLVGFAYILLVVVSCVNYTGLVGILFYLLLIVMACCMMRLRCVALLLAHL